MAAAASVLLVLGVSCLLLLNYSFSSSGEGRMRGYSSFPHRGRIATSTSFLDVDLPSKTLPQDCIYTEAIHRRLMGYRKGWRPPSPIPNTGSNYILPPSVGGHPPAPPEPLSSYPPPPVQYP